ncbi:RNA polymerase sigma factor [Planctomyces sp. SH-PL14]|uniref:RNA polymerase sigma factor n=1 Tax=Planctomyces sp. SH-PL14 TaxID=1632864 RepID=UPI00078DC4A2|nr:sigma-70 family RNA polymerase sigma factor [Planctomyces sp. SH-PL14]AMV20201.1 RNA polymerase sigma factor [Planctomyces sp. SH-PL14]
MDLANLIERIRTGDEDACTSLVRDYEPELRRFIRFRMTSSSVRRFVDSLDICQSVLARFFRSLDSDELDISDPAKLRALLLQIAQNRIYDAVALQHAKKRDARRTELGGDELLASLQESTDHVERILEMQELVERVYTHCSDADRSLIERRMNGADWNELAASAGATEEAVRKRVERAIEKAAVAAGVLKKT